MEEKADSDNSDIAAEILKLQETNLRLLQERSCKESKVRHLDTLREDLRRKLFFVFQCREISSAKSNLLEESLNKQAKGIRQKTKFLQFEKVISDDARVLSIEEDQKLNTASLALIKEQFLKVLKDVGSELEQLVQDYEAANLENMDFQSKQRKKFQSLVGSLLSDYKTKLAASGRKISQFEGLKGRLAILNERERLDDHIQSIFNNFSLKFRETEEYFQETNLENAQLISSMKSECLRSREEISHGEKYLEELKLENGELDVPVKRASMELNSLSLTLKNLVHDQRVLRVTTGQNRALKRYICETKAAISRAQRRLESVRLHVVRMKQMFFAAASTLNSKLTVN